MRERIERIHARLRTAYGSSAAGAHTPVQAVSRDLVDTLVMTILSQNTTDRNSERAFRRLRERFPTWEAVMEAPPGEVVRAIEVGGLAPTKGPRIQSILRQIKEDRGSIDLSFLEGLSDQEAMDYLCSFRGVGPKTAAVVLLFGLGRDVFPVDTHVHRVVRRLGLADDRDTPEKVQRTVGELLPPGAARDLHVNLIRHGREVCKARSPRCDLCILATECPSAEEGRLRASEGS